MNHCPTQFTFFSNPHQGSCTLLLYLIFLYAPLSLLLLNKDNEKNKQEIGYIRDMLEIWEYRMISLTNWFITKGAVQMNYGSHFLTSTFSVFSTSHMNLLCIIYRELLQSYLFVLGNKLHLMFCIQFLMLNSIFM